MFLERGRMKYLIKRRIALSLAIGVGMALLMTIPASAHTPLLYVEDNEDGTIYVEAGFSDGSSGSGMACRLEDKDGNVLWEGKFDEYGSLTIEKPDVVPYYVVFDGGPGHAVTKQGPALTPAEGGTAEVPVEEAPAAIPEAPEAPAQAAPEETKPAESTEAPAAPVTQGAPTWAPGAETPSWTPGTTTATPQAQVVNNTPLWVMVGLLSVIALAIVTVCGVVLFFIGWTMGKRFRD